MPNTLSIGAQEGSQADISGLVTILERGAQSTFDFHLSFLIIVERV
jgi:hypothetical protein